jgi:hypothetical protein
MSGSREPPEGRVADEGAPPPGPGSTGSLQRDPIEGRDVRFRVIGKNAISEQDVARMVELLTLAFGHWPQVDPGVAPAEHLRWKMSSPAAPCSAVLGESVAELVTTDTAIGYRLRLRRREALRVQFVDHAVRPRWRGHGVSSASIAFRQRTVAPLYDLSISDAQSPAMIRRGVKFGTRRFGNPLHPLVLPLRRRVFAQRWARSRGLPAWAGLPFAALLEARQAARRRRSSPPSDATTYHVVAIEHFDDRIDRFFATAGEPWDLIMVRSRDHLAWRYCDRRGGQFFKRLAQDAEGAVLGYAVAAARGDKGYLVDLLALPGRTDVVGDLVAESTVDLDRAGCVDILCWLPSRHPYRPELRRAGFLDVRHMPSVTYRTGAADPEDLDFLAEPETRIHYMLGDTDLV